MQIRITMKYHYTPPRRAKTKNEKLVTTVNIAEGTGPLKLLLNRT